MKVMRSVLLAFVWCGIACGSPGYIVVQMTSDTALTDANRLLVAVYSDIELPPIVEEQVVVAPPFVFPLEQVLEPSATTPARLQVHVRVYSGETIVAHGGEGFRWEDGRVNRVRVPVTLVSQ